MSSLKADRGQDQLQDLKLREALSDYLTKLPAAQEFYQQLAPGYQRHYREWVAKARDSADLDLRLRHAGFELAKQHRVLKIGSYMGDVRGPKLPAGDDAALRQQLIDRSESCTQAQMAAFAIALCIHVSQQLGLTADPILQATIKINRQWLAKRATFQDARAFAGRPMAASRQAHTPKLKAFYRMCHQAALTPHVKRHALIAADFAILTLPGQEGRLRAEFLQLLRQIAA